MSRKLTSTEIQTISNEKFGFFDFLERDNDSRYGFFICSKHGTKNRQYINSHLNGRNPCKMCRKKTGVPMRRTPLKTIKERLRVKFDELIRFHSYYDKTQRRAYFDCSLHGKTSDKDLGNVLHSNQRNNPCKECQNEQRPTPQNKLNAMEINNRLMTINSQLEFVRRKTTNARFGIFRCRLHGHVKRAKLIAEILSKRIDCPKCKGERTPPANKFSKKKIQTLSDKAFGQFLFLGRCKTDKSSGIFICKSHIERGIHKQFISNHIRGCNPCCGKVSKGEKKIIGYLIDRSYGYNSNKTFTECRNVNPLPFDFYVAEFNLLIEFDGKQHYAPVENFGGNKKYVKVKKLDKIKTEFTLFKKFNFLRIPYTHIRDIPSILDKYIKKIKLGEPVNKEFKPKYQVHSQQPRAIV